MAMGVKFLRDTQKTKDIAHVHTKLHWALIPEKVSNEPHEEAIEYTGVQEEAAEDSPVVGITEGSTDEPQVSKGDAGVARTTRHQPNPQYKDLREGVLRDAGLKLDGSANKNELHASALKWFCIQKKGFKAENKGHDQHMAAMKDISNVRFK